MKSSLQRLESVLQLLDGWNWARARVTDRFFVYLPPQQAATGFELPVPRLTGAHDFDRALDNCIAALAEYTGVPFNSVEASLMPSAEIVSVRLQGDVFAGGAVPLPQFERTLEHLKRTISRAASLIVTDDPLSQRIPAPAQRFLSDCWFLQTARGSFITRVAIPTAGTFSGKQLSLFALPKEKQEVSATLRHVSDLVGNRVLGGDEHVFSQEGFEAVRSTVSVGILEEFGRLLRGANAERIDLSFRRGSDESVVSFAQLNEKRLLRLDDYVAFVRDQFHLAFDLDVSGKVFEVRRARRGGKHSLVGLEAVIDDRHEYVTFRIEQEHLHVMLERFHSGIPIRVRGRARRLRTQIRIEQEFQYSE